MAGLQQNQPSIFADLPGEHEKILVFHGYNLAFSVGKYPVWSSGNLPVGKVRNLAHNFLGGAKKPLKPAASQCFVSRVANTPRC
ncbi:MAG: hypothetical protein U1F55_04440 [Chitinivorax sp.]